MKDLIFEARIVKVSTQANDDGSTQCDFVVKTKIRTPEGFSNLTHINRNLDKTLKFNITGDQLEAFSEES